MTFLEEASVQTCKLDLIQVCLLCKILQLWEVFGFGKFLGSYRAGRAKMRAKNNPAL